MSIDNIPRYLKHQPIIGVDYQHIDEEAGAGDAEFLSIGKAQWNPNDISAKVFRKRSDNGWSRQSEELPLWRVLDLTQLIIARISGQESFLNESEVPNADIAQLDEFLQENMEQYLPRIRKLYTLLSSNIEKPERVGFTPNVFDFATSELSQDAVLCYIFSWADDKYLSTDKGLCNVAKEMLSLFAGIPTNEIHNVSVGRQWKNIDIWVEINDDAFLIIEDKTSTTIHDNQLERYKAIVENEYSGKRDKLSFAYFKTENEPLNILKQIKSIGYIPISRAQVLNVLRPYSLSKTNEKFITDYVAYLENIETATQEYKTKPVNEWTWYQWQGFFKRLEKDIDVESWDYVANPNGGFLGLWWHFEDKPEDNVRMYLQFEEQKLCVKIEYLGDKNRRSEIRDKYHAILMKEAEEMSLPVKRPSRFGTGTYMTIGVVAPEDIFINDHHHIDLMIEKLHLYEKLVDECVKYYQV